MTKTNQVFLGDNLSTMKDLPNDYIDLIYIDPPFGTNHKYEATQGSFSDIWEGGILSYLIWLNTRFYEMKRILKKTGTIYVHCDWHASHYIKVEMDKIFGYENFLNELIWSYKTGGASKTRFARKHDTILFYSKTDKWKFNAQKERSYMMHKYGFKKSDFQIDVDSGLQYSMVYARDVLDIPSIGSDSAERLGYPTQKPEALLDRLIRAGSDEGDLVADFFCGSGTTLAVAQKLNRQWIGCDQSPEAVALTKNRLGNTPCP